MGNVVALGVIHHRVCAVSSRNRDRTSAQALGHALTFSDIILVRFAELPGFRGFDIQDSPGSMKTVGESPGITHECRRTTVLRNAGEHAVAGFPRTRDRMGFHAI